MELNHLKYFYYVAREGGFSKASRFLKVAQPAVSKMVQNLELSLGHVLLHRKGRSVQLTQKGNDLYRRCQIIFAQVESIQNSMAAPKSKTMRGAVCVCAAEPIANYVLHKTVRRIASEHAQVSFKIQVAPAQASFSMLSKGLSDVGIFFHMPELSEDLTIVRKLSVEFLLVVATDKKLNSEVCSSFIGSREIDNVSVATYPTLSKLQKIYPTAHIKISSNSLSNQLNMVLDGLGVSILPRFMVADGLRAGVLSTLLSNQAFTFELKIVCRKAVKMTSEVQVFIESFEKDLNELKARA
jgi:DNA-binding transcriptional LysR family regulator